MFAVISHLPLQPRGTRRAQWCRCCVAPHSVLWEAVFSGSTSLPRFGTVSASGPCVGPVGRSRRWARSGLRCFCVPAPQDRAPHFCASFRGRCVCGESSGRWANAPGSAGAACAPQLAMQRPRTHRPQLCSLRCGGAAASCEWTCACRPQHYCRSFSTYPSQSSVESEIRSLRQRAVLRGGLLHV